MFDKDYFTEDVAAGPNKTGRTVGTIGAWGLHLVKVAFLVYSGYHGINASWTYAGNGDLARVAQTVGIVVLECTLFGLYLAWHNQRITGAAQSLAAGATYALGFLMACLGVVADSQLNSGVGLASVLAWYLRWGLPVAPALMALGAVLTHELAPEQQRARRQSAELLTFAEDRFTAHVAGRRAELDAAKTIANMQLNARSAAARQIAQWYASDHAQRAITATALQNAPALLRAIGVNVDDVPDVNQSGELDLEDLVAYLVEERLRERDQIAAARPVAAGGNGHRPDERPTAPR
ncbi:MAG: hypothetical protein L0332_24260 [Chloroflexi bacterium]|nr:hypothetical protein [Chloroflexota bacterium]MCI0648592.1 hypothetical protein [Chloroflexota bacterium]MCI0729809.1 hypothetical protein [Chloroflexota bacterium]